MIAEANTIASIVSGDVFGLTLSAISQFGMYLQAKRIADMQLAQFEERRNNWIEQSSQQWIEEHSSINGIKKDITQSLVTECREMFIKIKENRDVAMPQFLLLRISRITEFIDANYKLIAHAYNSLIIESRSDQNLLFDTELNSQMLMQQYLDEDELNVGNHSVTKGLFKTLLGIPLLMVGGTGAIPAALIGGGMIGNGATEAFLGIKNFFSKDTSGQDFEPDYLPLFQIGVAVDLLEIASSRLNQLITAQDFPNKVRFLVSDNKGEINFHLEKQNRFFSFLNSKPKLKILSAES